MSVINQVKNISAGIRLFPNKLKGIFKVTQFDRLVGKHLSTDDLSLNLPRTFTQEMVISYMSTQILQSRSQHDFVDFLKGENGWRQTIGFTDDIPVQSTFSRYWSNPGYHDPLDDMFKALQKLIGLKNIHIEHELPPEVLRIIQIGYFPLPVDASFITLSNKRFDYAKMGYSAMEKGTDFGAKINLIIDGLLNMPLSYVPTSGDIHETKSIDVLIDELITETHPWLKKWFGKTLKPLLIIDRGYWNKQRFFEWTEHDIGFICPRKRKTLTGVQIEWLDFSSPLTTPLEGLVWIDAQKEPLRWIVTKSKSKKLKYWDLITNIFELSVKDVVNTYIERWPIEEIFKWLKQYTNIKRPLTESWDGFIFHCYIIMILLLLLQYFLALLGIPRWQDNLTELWRQLRASPDGFIDLYRLRIPLAFLKGGMN